MSSDSGHSICQMYVPEQLQWMSKEIVELREPNIHYVLVGYRWTSASVVVTAICSAIKLRRSEDNVPLQQINKDIHATSVALNKIPNLSGITYGLIGELVIFDKSYRTCSNTLCTLGKFVLSVDVAAGEYRCELSDRMCKPIVIIYNPVRLLTSSYFSTRCSNSEDASGLLVNLLNRLRSHNTVLDFTESALATCDHATTILVNQEAYSSANRVDQAVCRLIAVVLSGLVALMFIIHHLTKYHYVKRVLLWLSKYFYSIRQLSLKCEKLHEVVWMTEKYNTKWKNLVAGILVDSLLGTVVIMYCFQYLPLVSSALLNAIETVANELSVLLSWLMGVPGGLKLNRELNESLGTFFLYHVHLWKTYIITFIKPVLHLLISGIMMTGCAGVTLQLTLLTDLTSLLTFHVSCFYVYAARVYVVITWGLFSLWALFRGRKWNVLRRRVDTLPHYDPDQLVLGTLLFTTLLFLYPTSLLYYAVFAGLHVVVLLIQHAVILVIHCINVCPWYLLICRLLYADITIGDVYYDVCTSGEGTNQLTLLTKYTWVSPCAIVSGWAGRSWSPGVPGVRALTGCLPQLLHRLTWGYLLFDITACRGDH